MTRVMLSRRGSGRRRFASRPTSVRSGGRIGWHSNTYSNCGRGREPKTTSPTHFCAYYSNCSHPA